MFMQASVTLSVPRSAPLHVKRRFLLPLISGLAVFPIQGVLRLLAYVLASP